MNRTSRYPMRRILVFAVVMVVLVGVFVVKLVDVQIVRASELNVQAQDARSVPVTVYGARGDIVDAAGQVLADTVMRYDIALSPKQAMKGAVTREQPDPADPDKTIEVDVPLEQVAAELGAVIGLTGEQVQGIIAAALADDADSDFAYVAKLVDTATYEAVKALDIPGSFRTSTPAAAIPTAPSAATCSDSCAKTTASRSPGLELSENECLASEDGEVSYLHSLKDWVRIPGSEVVHKEAHDGGTLQLTIDADLQFFVQRIAEEQRRAVGADWATVTVMEAKTGRLLAVADVPTIDPNDPGRDGQGRPRIAGVHRAVRAGLDVQGPHGGIRHQRRQGRPAQPHHRRLPVPAAEWRQHQRQLLPRPHSLHPHGRAHRLVEHGHVDVR